MSDFESALEALIERKLEQLMSGKPREPLPLLSADEVGARLGGIDKQAVYRLKREGALKAVYLSATRFMFSPEEVERFIREGGVKPC